MTAAEKTLSIKDQNSYEYRTERLKELFKELTQLAKDDGNNDGKVIAYTLMDSASITVFVDGKEHYLRVYIKSGRYEYTDPPAIVVNDGDAPYGKRQGACSRYAIDTSAEKIHARVLVLAERIRERQVEKARREAEREEEESAQALLAQRLAPILKSFGMEEGFWKFSADSSKKLKVDAYADGAKVTLEVTNLTPERVKSLLAILTGI